MPKECPNCKAVGKKKYLSYKTDWNANKTAKTGYYVCRYCGFKTRA